MEAQGDHSRRRRLRHGEPPLSREGARACRRTRPDHARPRRPARRRRLDRPRRGGIPQGHGQPPRARPRRADRRAPRRRRAGARHLPRHAAAVRVLGRAGRRRGAGPPTRDRHAARAGGGQAAPHRLEPRPLPRRVAAHRRPAGRVRLLPRPQLRSPAGRPRRRARRERIRRALRQRGGPRSALRCAVPPREVLDARPRPVAQLRGGVLARAGVILYPAIDVLDGRAVRLVQGDFDDPSVYAEDPMAAAHQWVSQGAQALHVVDLDGARAGAPVNVHHVRAILDTVDVPVQVGGGLRSADAVADVLEAGATRAVVGTAAHRDPEFLDDVGAGRVAKGTEFVDLRDAGDPVELAAHYGSEGADGVVFLDITATHEKRDTVAELARRTADDVFVPFTIGGGIRSVQDAQAVLDAGADKISVNAAAVAGPGLSDELARVFGAQGG